MKRGSCYNAAAFATLVVCIAVLESMCGAVPSPPSHYKTLRNSFLTRAEVVDAIAPSASCVRNATHCTCRQQIVSPLTKIGAVGAGVDYCSASVLEKEEMTCACPGDSLCTMKEFQCTKVRKLEGDATAVPRGSVACKSSRGTCTKAENEKVCSSHSNIFIDGVLRTCVRNVPVVSDVDDAYGYSNSRANNLEGTLHDYINVRMVESTSSSDVHMCVIFGNWKIGGLEFSDDTAPREEKVRFNASFPINVEIMDDPSDQLVGDGTNELFLSLAHTAQSTDGVCIGPLLNDGSGIRGTFFDLRNMRGINIQTSEPDLSISSMYTWNFAANRPASTLTPEGRSDGDESVTVDIQPVCGCGI
mmetsp:Transcript_10774/g.28822  ORF Transcript_10774/g.28822 Transcript_10774/m.28822 type:complete len:359 (-) Transcript_10774:437-1513(-)